MSFKCNIKSEPEGDCEEDACDCDALERMFDAHCAQYSSDNKGCESPTDHVSRLSCNSQYSQTSDVCSDCQDSSQKGCENRQSDCSIDSNTSDTCLNVKSEPSLSSLSCKSVDSYSKDKWNGRNQSKSHESFEENRYQNVPQHKCKRKSFAEPSSSSFSCKSVDSFPKDKYISRNRTKSHESFEDIHCPTVSQQKCKCSSFGDRPCNEPCSKTSEIDEDRRFNISRIRLKNRSQNCDGCKECIEHNMLKAPSKSKNNFSCDHSKEGKRQSGDICQKLCKLQKSMSSLKRSLSNQSNCDKQSFNVSQNNSDERRCQNVNMCQNCKEKHHKKLKDICPKSRLKSTTPKRKSSQKDKCHKRDKSANENKKQHSFARKKCSPQDECIESCERPCTDLATKKRQKSSKNCSKCRDNSKAKSTSNCSNTQFPDDLYCSNVKQYRSKSFDKCQAKENKRSSEIKGLENKLKKEYYCKTQACDLHQNSRSRNCDKCPKKEQDRRSRTSCSQGKTKQQSADSSKPVHKCDKSKGDVQRIKPNTDSCCDCTISQRELFNDVADIFLTLSCALIDSDQSDSKDLKISSSPSRSIYKSRSQSKSCSIVEKSKSSCSESCEGNRKFNQELCDNLNKSENDRSRNSSKNRVSSCDLDKRECMSCNSTNQSRECKKIDQSPDLNDRCENQKSTVSSHCCTSNLTPSSKSCEAKSIYGVEICESKTARIRDSKNYPSTLQLNLDKISTKKSSEVCHCEAKKLVQCSTSSGKDCLKISVPSKQTESQNILITCNSQESCESSNSKCQDQSLPNVRTKRSHSSKSRNRHNECSQKQSLCNFKECVDVCKADANGNRSDNEQLEEVLEVAVQNQCEQQIKPLTNKNSVTFSTLSDSKSQIGIRTVVCSTAKKEEKDNPCNTLKRFEDKFKKEFDTICTNLSDKIYVIEKQEEVSCCVPSYVSLGKSKLSSSKSKEKLCRKKLT